MTEYDQETRDRLSLLGNQYANNRLSSSPRFRDQRDGQLAMNTLWEVCPEVYRDITGSDLDPFYQDSRLSAFWTHIMILVGEIT